MRIMIPEHLATDPPKEKGRGWWVMQFPAIIRRLSRTTRGIWLDAAEDPSFADILLSAFCIRIFGDGTTPSAPAHSLVIYPRIGKCNQYKLYPLPLSGKGIGILRIMSPSAPVIGAQIGESISGAHELDEWGIIGKEIYTYKRIYCFDPLSFTLSTASRRPRICLI